MSRVGFLDSLSPRLTKETQTKMVPKKSAAVALIFRDARDDEEVLLIRRAEREGDPWSGQVALPGGMVNPEDRSFRDTAIRETREEVGVDLSPGAAASLGYMRDFRAHAKEIVVVPSVFKLLSPSELTPSAEVASSEWASLGELAGEQARSSYLIPRGGGQIPFACIVHHGLVIWGLTEKILSDVIRGRKNAGGV